MTIRFPIFILIFFAFVSLVACQKEYSYEANNDILVITQKAWALTGNDSLYAGCIDTAYYDSVPPLKTLIIQGSDSLGNSFQAVLSTTASAFVPGTYSLSTGSVFSFRQTSGVIYSVGQSGTSFSMQVTTISESVVEATFTGVFKSSTGATLTVKNGKLKAFISAANPCGTTVAPPPVGTNQFKFTQGSSTFSGTATATHTQSPLGGSVLSIGGMATGSQLMDINIGLPGTTIVPGNYATATAQSSFNSFHFTSPQGTTIIYQSDATTLGASMLINIASYNSTTKVVQGSFAGIAKNSSNQNVSITSGSFSTVVQ